MAMSLSWITDSTAGQALFVDPGQPAVAFDDGAPLTWTELRQAELHYARSLQRAGVSRGDRVGLLLRNSLDYIVFFLAIARVGAIAVRLNFRLAAPELSFILNDAGATLLVFEAEFAGPIGLFALIEVDTTAPIDLEALAADIERRFAVA